MILKLRREKCQHLRNLVEGTRPAAAGAAAETEPRFRPAP